jgi:hypothetical protein
MKAAKRIFCVRGPTTGIAENPVSAMLPLPLWNLNHILSRAAVALRAGLLVWYPVLEHAIKVRMLFSAWIASFKKFNAGAGRHPKAIGMPYIERKHW